MKWQRVEDVAAAVGVAVVVNLYASYSTIADEDYEQRNAGYVRMDCEYAIDMGYADQTDTEPCYVQGFLAD